MSNPIEPSSNIPQQRTPSPAEINVPQAAAQLQSQAIDLAQELQNLLDDPTQTTSTIFLQTVATNASQLNQTVEIVLQNIG